MRRKIHFPRVEHPPREDEPRPRVCSAHPAEDHDHEGRAHAELRDRRPRGGSFDAPVEAVHEQHLEDDVHDIPGDHDDERRPQVGDPAQVPLAAEREKRGRETDRGDAEVRDCVLRGLPLASHELDERLGENRDERRHRDPERKREPERLRAETPRDVALSRPARARDLSGRPVLEEVEDRERPSEDGRCNPERRQLRPPEMADDRGVDQEVERFRGKCAQRGNRELADLAVVRRAQLHASFVAAIVAS